MYLWSVSCMPGICHKISSSPVQDGSVILLWQCRWALKESAGALSFLPPPADEKLDQITENVPLMGHMSQCCEWYSVMDLHGTDGLAFNWALWMWLSVVEEIFALGWQGKTAERGSESVLLFFKCFSFLQAISWLDFSLHYSSRLGELPTCRGSQGFQNCGFTLVIQHPWKCFHWPLTKGRLAPL